MTKIDLGKVAITLHGEWLSSAFYEKLSVVTREGQGYISLRPTTGDDPKTSPLDWMLLVARGESLYQMMVREGLFDGTEEEFLLQYQATLDACTEATQSSITQQNAVIAEMRQVESAMAGVASFMAEYAGNEAGRQSNEANRQSQETNRQTGESARIEAEEARAEAEQERQEAETSRKQAERPYSRIDKVAGPLFDVTYPSLDYAYAKDYFENHAPEVTPAGCSVLVKDGILARSYDWKRKTADGKTPCSFAVHTPAAQGHFAVVGMAGGLDALTEDVVEARLFSEAYKILPFCMLDGKNEKDLFAEMNVVPTWHNTRTVPTVEKRESISAMMLVRYILDNFQTVDDAVAYLQNYVEVYMPTNLDEMGYELHFLIADATKSVAIEFVDNAIVAIETDKLTNFHLSGVTLYEDGSVYTNADVAEGNLPSSQGIEDYAGGLERFNILNAATDPVEAIKAVVFSKAYTDLVNVWFSEFVGGDLTVNTRADDPDLLARIAEYRQKWEDQDNDVWISVHQSIYRLGVAGLDVAIREGSDEHFVPISDHAQAQSDHSTAQADHQTAQSDHAAIAGKADKVSDATAGHLAALDSDGNLEDSETGLDASKKYGRKNGRWVEIPEGFVRYDQPQSLSDVERAQALANLGLTIEDIAMYGIEFDTTVSSPACARIGNPSLHKSLPIHNLMRGCLLDDSGQVVEYLPDNDWTNVTRDGSRGQVMVEIPAHYRKFETSGTKRRVKISQVEISGYHLVPKQYVSAYEATVQRSVNKLASVVNNTADFRGCNNQSDWDGTYRTALGRPATNISLTGFRNYARNRGPAGKNNCGWNCMTYDIQKELYWLFVIEYATFNSQAAYNAQLTSEGYRQGGLGDGVTNAIGTDWNNFNSYYPFVPCGYTDEFGNGSGVKALEVHDGDDALFLSTYVNRYRGIEIPFGHIYHYTDGVLVEAGAESDTNLHEVFAAKDPAKFASVIGDGYAHVGNQARADGYGKEHIFGEGGEIIATVVGGSTTTYMCDYIYQSIPESGKTTHGIQFGGSAFRGMGAGFVAAYTSHGPTGAYSYTGSRLCFIP